MCQVLHRGDEEVFQLQTVAETITLTQLVSGERRDGDVYHIRQTPALLAQQCTSCHSNAL